MTLADDVGLPVTCYVPMTSIAFELLENGQLEGAQAVFEGLLALDEENSVASGGLGAVREAQGRRSEALALYEVALKANSTNTFAAQRREQLRSTD